VLPQDLTIHENNGLRSLIVYFCPGSPPILDSMTTILLQISSPHMRDITIHVLLRSLIEDGKSDFMDEILSRPMFSGLQSVTFKVSDWKEVRSECWFKQKLPLCAARGILSVIY
jgi:hypothetical protein